jgi:hypothetical protein
MIRVLGTALSWVVGLVVVRLGLAWADTFPYSAASEVRYGLVATAALSVAIGGTVVACLWGPRTP